jgi:hypothetical protein
MKFDEYFYLSEGKLANFGKSAWNATKTVAKNLDPWGKGGLLGRATTKAQEIENYLRGGVNNIGAVGHEKRRPVEISQNFNNLISRASHVIIPNSSGSGARYILKYNDINNNPVDGPIYEPYNIAEYIIKIQTQYENRGHAHAAAMKEAASHFDPAVMNFARDNYIL